MEAVHGMVRIFSGIPHSIPTLKATFSSFDGNDRTFIGQQ